MSQAEEICEHIIMVHEGCKVLDDALATIRSRYDPRSIQLEPLDPTADTAADTAALRAIPEVERVQDTDRGAEILLRNGTDTAAAMRRIMETVPASRIELTRPRLEDIFIRIVAGGASDGDADRLRAALRDSEAEEAIA